MGQKTHRANFLKISPEGNDLIVQFRKLETGHKKQFRLSKLDSMELYLQLRKHLRKDH